MFPPAGRFGDPPPARRWAGMEDEMGSAIRGLGKRRWWREADARAVLEAWRSDEESLAGFARRHGLGYKRLSWWRGRLQKTAGRVRFHRVRLVNESRIGNAVERSRSSFWE